MVEGKRERAAPEGRRGTRGGTPGVRTGKGKAVVDVRKKKKKEENRS